MKWDVAESEAALMSQSKKPSPSTNKAEIIK